MKEKAIKIAIREWNNIRRSLEKCGDVGELVPEDVVTDDPILVLTKKFLLFTSSLIEMDKELLKYRYRIPEASDVFAALATKSAERLGLARGLGLAFGRGYSYVRTGLLRLQGTELQQTIFFKIFFPQGADFNWDFNSSLVKTMFKAVFDKFMRWQNNPQLYAVDMGMTNANTLNLELNGEKG
ncbi:MAG: hypothetical protein ACREOW_08250 [Thermodesulfobacteriota bacterium]